MTIEGLKKEARMDESVTQEALEDLQMIIWQLAEELELAEFGRGDVEQYLKEKANSIVDYVYRSREGRMSI